MHRKRTTAEDGMQTGRSVSHSGKTLRWYLSFRPVAVLAAACAALLTTGLVAGPLADGMAGAATPNATSHALATSGLGYTPLAAPVRIADTRTVAGGGSASSYNGKTLAEGTSLTVDVPSTDVPATASAVVVNVTAVNPSAGGFLSVYPGGGTNPGTSNDNFAAGQNVGDQVTVGLGPDAATSSTQSFTVYDGPATGGATVDFTADLVGYYAPTTSTTGDPYNGLTPARILDTRTGSGETGAGSTLTGGGSINVQVTGVGGVPASATAVALNVAVTNTTAPSFITVFPTGQTQPVTASQNFVAGETLSAQAVAGVGTGGDVTIANHAGNADIVVDVDGYYNAPSGAGGTLTVLSQPVRLQDTRANGNILTGAGGIAGGASTTAVVQGAGASAGVLSIADVATPGDGNFLTAYPTGGATPLAATVNYVPGDPYNIVENAAYATTGTGGSVSVLNGPSNASPANIVVDEDGYFTGSNTQVPSTYTVTPTTSTTTATGTAVTYTVTGCTAANTPTGLDDLALFPAEGADAPTGNSSGPLFNPTTGVGPAFVPQNGSAIGQDQTTNVEMGKTLSGTFFNGAGYIAAVNGVSTAGPGTYTVPAISCATGGFTFTLDSSVADSTIPVVFSEPTNASVLDSFQVTANGSPETGYPVGVGGATTWQAAAAPAGDYANYSVESDPNGTFVACSSPTSVTCYTFNYTNAGDTFNYPEPNSAVGDVDNTIPLSESQFAADLSGAWTTAVAGFFGGPGVVVPGDVLAEIDYSPTAASVFDYESPITFVNGGDYPAAPTGVTAAAVPGAVLVSWTAVPNQDVSSGATIGTTAGAGRAYYIIYRETIVAGVPTGYSVVGTTLPGGGGNEVSGQAPPTSFINDVNVVNGATYVYSVQAVSDDHNFSEIPITDDLVGPPSALSAPVTATVTSAAAAPPLSINASSNPPGGDLPITPSPAPAGDTFTVGFNQAVTLASTFNLFVTDGNGNEAELDNTDATAAVITGTDGANTAVEYTLTTTPQMIFGTAAGLELTGLEIVSQSGVTGTSGGGAWNVVGSGQGTPNPATTDVPALSRVFNGTTGNQNNALPEGPLVSSESAPNSVVATAENGGSGTLNVYNSAGVLIGSAVATGTSQTITTTTAFASGASLFVTQSNITGDLYQESLATFTGPVLKYTSPGETEGANPPVFIAPSGSLGNNQEVTVTATVTVLGSPDPNASLLFLFNSTAPFPGSASIAGTTLTATPFPFTTNASGQIAIDYTTSGSAVTDSGVDSITALSSTGSTIQNFGSANGSDIYSYNGAPIITPTTGPDIGLTSASTSNLQPTWTGTATTPATPVGDVIVAVTGSIDGGPTTDASISSGAGTDSVVWSWTPAGPVGNGPHTVVFTAISNDVGDTSTGAIAFTETGNPLAITAVNSGLSAPFSATSGPADGGNLVTITGTGFDNATAVHFGSPLNGTTEATSFSVVSNTEIQALPQGGTNVTTDGASVTVTNSGGSSPSVAADDYTYVGPTAETIAFANGGVSSTLDPGDTITLTYDEGMNPATMGAALNQAGNILTAGSGTTTPVSFNAIMGTTGTLGSFATAATGTDTVNATLSADGTTLVLTFVAVNGAAPSGAFTPVTSVHDRKGNAEAVTAPTQSGTF